MMKIRRLICGIIITFMAGACKEPFPPYVEPQNVLEAVFVRTSPDTLYVTADSSETIVGWESMTLQVHVINMYPQLLQGDVLLKGRIDYFLTEPVVKTGQPQTLSRYNLYTPPVVQNTIAVPPGKYADLHCELSLMNRGVELYAGVPFSEKILTDSTRIQTYQPITVEVRGTVQIFERVQPITISPMTFKQTVVKIIMKH